MITDYPCHLSASFVNGPVRSAPLQHFMKDKHSKKQKTMTLFVRDGVCVI